MPTGLQTREPDAPRRDRRVPVPDPEPVAILAPVPERHGSRLSWFRPSGRRVEPMPGVPGFWHFDGTRPPRDGDPSPPRPGLDRLVERQRRRLEDAAWRLRPGALEVSERACVELVGADGSMAVPFSEIRLAGSAQRVFVRGLSDLPRFGDDGIERITIVTGVCLFSSHSVSLHAADGTSARPRAMRSDGAPVVSISVDEPLTLYELESAARLADCVADLVAALPDGPEIAITVDIPRVQYYFYLLDLHADGIVDGRLLRRWFQIVDRRCRRVLDACRGELEHRLQARGQRARATIETADSLDGLRPAIDAELRAGRMPDARAQAGRLVRTLLQLDPQRRAGLVGLYPLESVLVDAPRASLYFADLGERIVDESGRSCAPAQLVRRLHG